MFPTFCCGYSGQCNSSEESRIHYYKRKLQMLKFWREGIERQLAALDASINTLQSQIDRNQADA
ncbi:sigma factor SigF [cyanobiont of Ornithocercus magnificus]|nr:sigma factor SigF [cyanobiont of Ornithocercus magnificus]